MRGPRYWEVPPLPGEDAAAHALRAGTIYFEAQAGEIAEWWRRIGWQVPLAGARVLDVGCGHGALCLDAVRRGAASVTGVDTDGDRIRFGRDYLQRRYPREAPAIDLVHGTVDALAPQVVFDIVTSKDTFEHLQDPAATVAGVARRLRPGGLFVCGFSPLYYSPNGDHGRYRLPLPGLHALLPQPWVLRWASRRLGRTITAAQDVGLNRLTLPEFQALLPPTEWETVALHINPMRHPLRPAFDLLRRIGPLARYFTVGVYGVFRRSPTASSR
jgi:SAM-dependent methyltransferase